MSDYHFINELKEQPAAVAETVRTQQEAVSAIVESLPADLKRVMMVGCGDPYFAAHAAIYPFERWSRVPAEAIDALEFRFWRGELADEQTVVILISQSGRTIQAVEAARLARSRGAVTVAITNSPESPLAEACHHRLVTAGGPSYSFPTRTTTTATALLYSLALVLGLKRGGVTADGGHDILDKLERLLPARMEQALSLEAPLRALARSWQTHRHFAFIGSGPGHASALVGAAKINETSRLQAEADQLEEYGHLHLFAIQRGTPLLFLAPSERTAARVRAMVTFAAGRNHPMAIFCPETALESWQDSGAHLFGLPAVEEVLAPLLYVLPLQLFAYHLAITLGNNPDRPEGFDNVAIQRMIYTDLLEGWHDETEEGMS